MANETQKLVGEFAGKAAEALALWTDANQKILGGLMDLGVSTAKEGVRLYAELQSSAVEAVIEGQGIWLRRQGDLVEWLRDPIGGYQKSLREGIEESQKIFKRVQSNAQTLSTSAERLQAAAEQTAGEIQQTLATLAETMKTLYTAPEK